jgi:hypothetical protein
MNDCAGCRFLDEEAGRGTMFCMLPLFRSVIHDPEQPPCEGLEFEPRFPMTETERTA